jgi:hypothetical protein
MVVLKKNPTVTGISGSSPEESLYTQILLVVDD